MEVRSIYLRKGRYALQRKPDVFPDDFPKDMVADLYYIRGCPVVIIDDKEVYVDEKACAGK